MQKNHTKSGTCIIENHWLCILLNKTFHINSCSIPWLLLSYFCSYYIITQKIKPVELHLLFEMVTLPKDDFPASFAEIICLISHISHIIHI